VVSLAERRRSVTYLKSEYEVSERRACQSMQMNRSSYHYVDSNAFEDERYPRVVSLLQQYPYWGYRKIYDLLRGEELTISRERV
jgi:putative transposase